MDRRKFLAAVGGASALAAMSASEKADALELAMSEELDKIVVKPGICTTYGREGEEIVKGVKRDKYFMMGEDPRLPKMSEKPTLIEFYKKRLGSVQHMCQSARLARKNGLPEKIVLACLLHDISVGGLIRMDHGYWGSQMVAPYVDEEIAWAIKYHQALRFYPDEEVGYEYPEAYIRYFGPDFKPEPYVAEAAEYARNHKWYMTARQITINDIYSFDPNVTAEIDDFEDIIGRHFKQPEEGLGFDNSPVAHMWRTMIYPNNFL
ncbi:MAG TPA: hypothetical protein P5227_08210 [Emcibacteraceae bacterium]|nr:hypothetical protein [Emcibacteraceae bacterium]HRW29965.1 hypothetical protein [Emcibacteraceae bacterium]